MTMNAPTDFLSTLNPSQRQAVQHFCGPLLVVAGAGSGKTRALTFRIANLIRHHKVDPENILAVTFTNKAAKEMKDRIAAIFAQELAQKRHQQRLEVLPELEQKTIRSQVYRQTTKHLWIGTFHGLCVRILRADIDKYRDGKGRRWDKNFSILDENDVQSLIKNIAYKKLNLDDKKFNHKTIRYRISNAKNLGISAEEFTRTATNYKERVIAEVYGEYQNELAKNNALDFDELILIPVRLFQQNETILGYWYQRFHHILVDEYQDTNRIQYEFIRLLTTNGESDRRQWQWQNRSLFVVGDADQSIYSFRMADFTILLEFQHDFGDGLEDDDTRTLVKLEENYRSKENILQVANHLIENNSQRIDKVLKATRGMGEEIYCHCAADDQAEARFVINKILQLQRDNPELAWKNFAILYRTNAQSRPFEDLLLRHNLPYVIIGGFKFYERKEIKDALAYLRLLVNPHDTVSLERIINAPKRGIGKKTFEGLLQAAQELDMPLWEIISDETSVNTLAGRAARAVNQFADLIKTYQSQMENLSGLEIMQGIMEDSGYLQDLALKGTETEEMRIDNIKQLGSAIAQYHEEAEDYSLQGFLNQAALNSDLDDLQDDNNAISLMSIHASKGLEFPIVFLVGLEQGLFPHGRSLQDALAVEEERRLCYVGITRAQEQLFLSYTRERYMWGSKEASTPSQFLKELPRELITTNIKQREVVQLVEENHRVTRSLKDKLQTGRSPQGHGKTAHRSRNLPQWQVGDQVFHKTFGEGEVTHLLGAGEKVNLAIRFPGLGQKIIDPRVAPLDKL